MMQLNIDSRIECYECIYKASYIATSERVALSIYVLEAVIAMTAHSSDT